MTDEWFRAPGTDQCEVVLRRLGHDEMLVLLDADPGAAGAATAPSEHRPLDGSWDGLVEIRPNLVALGDDDTNPVWWVQPAGAPGHLATLSYCLGLLAPGLRTEAYAAHLEVLADLVEHERAVRTLDDGWDLSEFEPRCVACWAEPQSHSAALADAVAERARELTDALAQFPVTFSAGT